MDFKLETEFSKADILKEVDALKKQVDETRPLPKDIEERVMQKLRLEWNYNSNAIEGNKLNYGETTALLMHGITAKGKPLKDHLDIQGHNDAINFLLSIIKEDRPFTEADIRQLHEITLVESYIVNAQTDDGKSTTKRIKLGTYKTSPNHVKTVTNEIHYYATPEETPAKMQELMAWYNEIIKDKSIHPIVIASLYHHGFTEIHPFDDGNGRVARLLMNLILMKSGYPPVVIKMDDRQNYYSLLSRADVGEAFPFVEYIVERLRNSLTIYVKGINNEDIDEDEDIDKDIALFKTQLKNIVSLKEKKSVDSVLRIITTDIYPLFFKVAKKAEEFDEFFFSSRKYLRYDVTKNNASKTEYILFTSQKLESELPVMQYDRIYFYCTFKEFRSSTNVFDINLLWQIIFDEYKYIIADQNSKEILSKHYHENISGSEAQKIVKQFILQLKSAMDYKIESPKSN
ncbi:MAG TPA: Fic family protein [Mucilaginibacter sp.]|nr:Fic family protein [Mucilaginibacter sp.]